MFARIGRLLRGFFSLFISGIEEANPEALMEAARQEFRQKMTQYNLALAKMAGVAERLKVQVKGKAARAQDLERRILANHSAGNIELAGTLARELQELKADLTTDTQELRRPRRPIRRTCVRRRSRSRTSRTRSASLEKQLSQVQIKEAQAEAATRALERRVQGRRSRRHDEDRRGRPAEALRSLRRQGARRARHGRHVMRFRRRKPSARRWSRTALAEFLASQGMQATPAPGVRARRRSRRWGLNR